MKKAKDMSKRHESKESTMQEGKETVMEKKGYKETKSGKMVKASIGVLARAIQEKKYKDNLNKKDADRLTEKDIKTAKAILMRSPEALGGMKIIEEASTDTEGSFAKGGMTKSQKKVGKVMSEFKAGKLHSGKSKKIVKNPKQAIAIALSEAGKSKMKKKGGGIAIAGMGAAYASGGSVQARGVKLARTRPTKLY